MNAAKCCLDKAKLMFYCGPICGPLVTAVWFRSFTTNETNDKLCILSPS